jgi:transcriptional regulator with XRE-family HTH domain
VAGTAGRRVAAAAPTPACYLGGAPIGLVLDPEFPRRLRELRQQAGLSIRALAAAALSSKSHVHEFETGAAVPTRETLALLDQAVGAAGGLEALVIPLDQRWEDPSVRRREFLAASVAVALPSFESDPVERARLHTARLRRLDDHLGGADTYPLYAAELDATTALIAGGGNTDTVKRGLLSVAAEQAQMAGFSAFDAGWAAEADRLFRWSLTAARDAGNLSLTANALTFLAYQATGSGGDGVALTVNSCDLAAGATPGVRALLHERCAWAHAVAGYAGDAERHLGLAESALHHSDAGSEPDWVFWVDATEVQIMTGRCWTLLRRPVRAIIALEQALAGYSDTHGRDKALYLTFLARAYLDANEIEQACAVASRAVDLADGISSARPQEMVAAFAASLDGYAGLAEVRDLRARVAEWVSRPLPAAPIRSTEPTPSPVPLQ